MTKPTQIKKDRHKPATRALWTKGQQQVQLRIPRPMCEEMRAHAARETMPLAAWIRYACLLELRRRKSSL